MNTLSNEGKPVTEVHIPPVCYIIPTYNRASALMLCLEHLERQTFSDFEVIIVDDGSADETPQLMEQYKTRTPLRLRYLRQENSGPARARNLAISLTQSPLSIIIGDDIFPSPNFTEVHLQFHQSNPDLHIAGLGLTVWNKTLQSVTPLMRWLDESGSQFAYQDLLRGETPHWNHFYTSNLSIKTELLRQNPFNEQFTKAAWMLEDVELGYRLEVEKGLKLIFVPNARAEHLHPTDFRKVCNRAYGAGLSWRVFDQLWPNRPVAPHSPLHRAIREFLCINPWLLRPLTFTVETLTRFWCPNPFLRFILAYHTALGRRRATQ